MTFRTELENIPLSIYPKNKTLNWSGTDDEKTWQYHIRKHPLNSHLEFYKNNPIKYSFNNYGYRTPYNFNKGDKVNIYLGCSYTVGVGLNLEDTWSYDLHKSLKSDAKYVNLSQGGQGIENQFRHFYYWKDYFQIENVFHYQPLYAREEFFTPYGPESILIPNENHSKYIKNSIDKKFLVTTLGSDIHTSRKYITNVLALQNLVEKLGGKYFFLHDLPNPSIGKRKSRDLAHFDLGQHKLISDLFYSDFTNNITEPTFLKNQAKNFKNLL